MTTLEEALAESRGTERPFNCPTHGDTHASASVNVVKGVWYCYACHASGSVGDAPPPSAEQLLSMVEPIKALVQRYSAMWPDMIEDDHGYWAERLGKKAARYYSFGTHPVNPTPVYLVSDEIGHFVGVVSRNTREDFGGPKYLYPRGFAASRNLFGLDKIPMGTNKAPGVIVLVESAADVAVLGSVGVKAFGCYGSGLHAPQKDLLRRHYHNHLVLVGFDTDSAGERGAQRALDGLGKEGVECDRVVWPNKDPGETGAQAALETVLSVVPETYVRRRKGRA